MMTLFQSPALSTPSAVVFHAKKHPAQNKLLE